MGNRRCARVLVLGERDLFFRPTVAVTLVVIGNALPDRLVGRGLLGAAQRGDCLVARAVNRFTVFFKQGLAHHFGGEIGVYIGVLAFLADHQFLLDGGLPGRLVNEFERVHPLEHIFLAGFGTREVHHRVIA